MAVKQKILIVDDDENIAERHAQLQAAAFTL